MKNSKDNSVVEVLEMSIPAAGEMTAYTLMSIFDTMMISSFGGNLSLSAVGLSNEIIVSIVNIFISYGIALGITSLTARCTGAKKSSLSEEFATLGFTSGIIIAVIMSLFIFLKYKEILLLAGARNEVYIISADYIRVLSVAMFFSMAVNLMNAILRGYGNTFTPFIVSIIIACVKLLFDVCLIYGVITPRLGIKGAAFASVIAEVSGALYLILYLKRFSRIKLCSRYIKNFNFMRIKDIIKLSLPSTLEEAAYSISRLICTIIIMYAGTTGFAANAVANTVESISIMPALGFGAAATTLVGIKVGEGNRKKARKYTYSCTYWAVLISIIFAVIFVFFPDLLVGTFIGANEKEALKMGALCLAIGALEQPTIAVSYVMAGALKGSGDTKSPFYISVFTSWGIRLPLIFYFIYILKKPVVYVWWVTAFQWAVDAFLMYISFRNIFSNK